MLPNEFITGFNMTINCLWEALNDLHVLAKITPNRQLEKGIISLSDQGAVLSSQSINSCLRVNAAHPPACSAWTAENHTLYIGTVSQHTHTFVYRNCESTHTHTHLYTGTMSQQTNLAHYDGWQLYRQIKTSHDGTRA